MQAIGIDIGTTSICGVVVDTESGELLRSRTENSNAFIDTENEWERIQSPEKIIALATDILDEFICDETVVIGVTGQMHGIVYTDKNGNAVSPLYTWQDGRGNLSFEDSTYAEHLCSHSGYGNVTDFYNRTNGIVPSEAVSYCTIHDYLVMKLCGLKKALVHTSDAASFGCFDLENNTFFYDNCNVEVVSDYRIAGEYKSVPVSVAIGDNQASVFSCLQDENEILINVGTGSQISVISDKIIVGENVETRPYFENKYLVVGAALCGGRAYAILKNFYSEILGYVGEFDEDKVYSVMAKMLEKGDGTTLSVDTRFSGSRADESLRGSISNISTTNLTPTDLTYGVLEGMMDELYNMYADMKLHREGVVASGNGIRKNPALAHVAGKMFEASLKIPAHTEEASLGAALFALIAAGHFENAKQAQKLIKFL